MALTDVAIRRAKPKRTTYMMSDGGVFICSSHLLAANFGAGRIGTVARKS